MSAIRHISQTEIVLHSDNGRDFKVVGGEIYEVVQGQGFVATTKVVVREDFIYVSRQLKMAVEV